MEAVSNSHECADRNAREPRKKFGHNSKMLTNPDNPLEGSILISTGVFSESFSIREYVGKVRNMNIRKSWPFSESLLDDCLREGRNQVLPPLERPIYRWWGSQHCVSIQRHGAQPGDNSEGIIVSEVDTAISKDLEEQIRKLSTVKISGPEDNTANREDGMKRKESKYERRYNYGHRHRSSAATSTPKFTSQSDGEKKLTRVQEKGKAESDSNVDAATRKQNQNGKPDKSPATERQVINFTFGSTKGESKSVTDAGLGDEIERPKKARKMARDQLPAGSNLTQTEKNKIDHLNLEETKSESVNVFDISNNDVSGLKVCPVCKTFTSTTVTAVNAHMDDCLAQASNAQKKHGKLQRQKSRAQKKRSIVDICAAALPVNIPADSSENLAMDTSADSDSTKANLKLKKTMVLMDTAVGSATTISCKRKRSIGAHSQEIGKAGRRKAETVETKRKRQRLRIISSLTKGVKALKKPSAAVRSKKADHGLQQHTKPSSVTEEARDSNAEEQPSTEEKSVKKHLAKKQQQSGILMDHAHATSVLSKKDKGKEGGVFKNNALVEENRLLPGEENRGQSLSNLTMANASSDVSRSYEMKDTATPQNQSSQSDYDKSDMLGDTEGRHQKAYSIDGSRLQLEETSKPQDPNLLRVSDKNSVYKDISPGENGRPEQFNVTCSESEFNVMQSVEERSPVQPDIPDQNQEQDKPRDEFVVITECNNDQQGNAKHNLGLISTSSWTEDIEWERENSKVQYDMKNEKLNWETRREAEENHIRNARLNLNKKVCFLPRDSKGRFLSSHGSNGGKAGDNNSPPHKRKQSQKSTKSLKNFPKTYSMEKEINHGKAHLSENANGHGKFNIQGNYSGYSYRGFPLDSQGELLRYIPNTIPGFNQLNKIANYSAGNEPLTSEGNKALQEFSFVESMKTFPDITPINQPLQRNSLSCLPQHNYSIQYQQPACRQDYSVSKTNQSNPGERGSQYCSLLDQIQRDGSSNGRSSGSSIGTQDAMSLLSMQAAIQFGYNEEQKEKRSALQKSCPGVDISRRKQPTPQPVMRLMGQSFTIGRENETANVLNDPQQCNSKHSRSIPGAIVRVTSPSQLVTHYNHHCTTCGKDQFYLQKPIGNAMCQHCRGKANMSKSLPYNLKETQRQEMRSSDSISIHKVGTSNHSAPNLIEKRLPTDYLFHGEPLRDRSYSSQPWISSSPASAPIANMFISPVGYLCNNTCLNEGQKMAYKGSHVSNHGYPLQQQTYSQLLSSCLGQQTFQKQQQNDWKHTGNTYSHPIHSDAIQSLPCTFNSLGSLSGTLQAVPCVPAHSTSFPTGTQTPCQAPSSSTSIADSPSLMLQGNGISSSINLAEQEKLLQKLPNNMARNRCEACCEKGGLIESINVDRKYGNIIRAREGVQQTEGLHGKLTSEKHEVCETRPMQKCDSFSIMKDLFKGKKVIHHQIGSSSGAAKHIKSREMPENNMLEVTHGQISKINDPWVEFAMDRRNPCDKKAENEPILNARPHTELPKKCPQGENGLFSRPNNNFLGMGMRTSANGLHCSNAGSPLELAEPIKLSGGAKHILKPSSQNGNGQQSRPIHYTQPFGETNAAVRDRNLEGTTAYK
ncbi:uncharacterized protein LOC131067003 [Cryptomeria japonica]|uniref:uncharacterized protein LOC131067003 n=1 Tax=Cryptomeria japonica TaxID=3369 RepID=UPI0025ACE0BE|nr:uncharacterized protein LOC131067003 [Cryptomeria japonica]XP_057857898.1 uncharacterized protein LOC131067003 [Cryptomeria japonica]